MCRKCGFRSMEQRHKGQGGCHCNQPKKARHKRVAKQQVMALHVDRTERQQQYATMREERQQQINRLMRWIPICLALILLLFLIWNIKG